jgi:CheY-like chemotaxis protein
VNTPAPLHPARVLVVDDDPLVGTAVRRVLTDDDVTFEDDPRNALQRLATGEQFDVILCDLHMPELGGECILGALGQLDPALRPSFVYMTGGGFVDSDQALLDAAPGGCLLKPFTPGELRSVVRQARLG